MRRFKRLVVRRTVVPAKALEKDSIRVVSPREPDLKLPTGEEFARRLTIEVGRFESDLRRLADE